MDHHQPPHVWYLLVDSSTGEAYKDTSADKVSVHSEADAPDVVQFRDEVKKKNPNKLIGIVPAQLIVYKNKDAFEKRNSDGQDKQEPLQADSCVEGLGKSVKEALIVVVPLPISSIGIKRKINEGIPAETWFPSDFSQRGERKQEKDSEDDRGERIIRYFQMKAYPPMAHTDAGSPIIIERNCYVKVYDSMLQWAREYLAKGHDANIHVCGNPGIGKSRFFLYCVFRLLLERNFVSKYTLMINYDDVYSYYDTGRNEFVSLNQEQIPSYMSDVRVFRLIEGKSDRLSGWKGVSVLFASPGLVGLNDFLKIQYITFYIPVWDFEELTELNAMLDEKNSLPENKLSEYFREFGGIPRHIFSSDHATETARSDEAINSFKASEVLSYVKGRTVRERHYSYRVLCLVPKEDLRRLSHLDFISAYVAEKIVEKVYHDSTDNLSTFYLENACDDSGATAAFRGRIYEMLCHRRLKLGGFVLTFTPLDGDPNGKFISVELPQMVRVVRFKKLDEIDWDTEGFVYFQPSSATFGALDSFIVDMSTSTCYGLQMTINKSHGIKHKPLCDFIEWLKKKGIHSTNFHFGFMVPNDLVVDFPKQELLTRNSTIHSNPRDIAKNIMQYVVPLDIIKK